MTKQRLDSLSEDEKFVLIKKELRSLRNRLKRIKVMIDDGSVEHLYEEMESADVSLLEIDRIFRNLSKNT